MERMERIQEYKCNDGLLQCVGLWVVCSLDVARLVSIFKSVYSQSYSELLGPKSVSV